MICGYCLSYTFWVGTVTGLCLKYNRLSTVNESCYNYLSNLLTSVLKTFSVKRSLFGFVCF